MTAWIEIDRVAIRTMALAVFLLVLPALAKAAEDSAVARVDFNRDVQPVLERSCYQCHGPQKQLGGLRLDQKKAALAGGDSGAAIVPGRSGESLLVQLVSGQDADRVMPEKGERLTAGEIGRIKAWIDAGAAWPEEPAAASKAHWSLAPVVRPRLPEGEKGNRSAIDQFISARLAAEQLSLSPEASKRALLRRVYFDLIGLPPTPEEMDRFLADESPRAYEAVVDRLLASPRHGERWASHWLDAVRFAESDGFETNKPRANAWHYRDYVIEAFNSDKPYDRFVIEQLAGDVLGVDAATGFLVGGANDVVKSPDPVLTAQQRADVLHDMVSTTSSALLGLTVGCARCHNHKFDPIPQVDYYHLKAVFEGVQHGERPIARADAPQREAKAAALRGELAKLEAELVQFEPLADPAGQTARRTAVNARLNVDRFAPVMAKKLRFTIRETNSVEPCIDELEVYTTGAAANVALASTGATARASSVFPNASIHKLEHLNDGRVGNSHSWISAEPGRGWVELEFPAPVKIDRVVWGRDREEKYRDRLPLQYTIEVAATGDAWQTVATSHDREKSQAGKSAAPLLTAEGRSTEEQAKLTELVAQRSHTEAELKQLTATANVYAGTFAPNPGATFRLHRGDPMQRRDSVAPGALAVIPATFRLDAAASETAKPLTADQQRRLALARWIADRANPLTARVIVNRLWQHHFGEGLVSTPSDFGVNGARPSHPELLDWLASELMASTSGHPDWSLRHVHRLIVCSATYRQASAARPEGMKADAQSRLLWRYPPRRLEAEPLRDAILSISGKLDLAMGGPGFSAFEPNENYVRVYNAKQTFGPEDWRRMVYMTKIRMQQDGTFGAFDCPDGGQIAPRRSRSTTPLQALNLLNSPFIAEQAAFFAARVTAEVGPEPADQVRRAIRLAYQREPAGAELAACEMLVRKHGLALFCRVLFNSNEFLYVY